MSGYLFFSAQQPMLSKIAEQINDAGNGYHHTESWSEAIEWRGGKSYIDLIQASFDAADTEIARLRREIDVLRLYGNKDCTAMADEHLAKERA